MVQLSHPNMTAGKTMALTLRTFVGKVMSLLFPRGLGGLKKKKYICNAGDMGLIPGSERFPGEGNGYPRHCSCVENPMDRETWASYSVWGCRVRHD